ncbi:MAG TPA: hypothetical protein DCX01_04855 [Bacteroidetes bacterium]|nr:hypothetical protein [Bacteroidota bacterium]
MITEANPAIRCMGMVNRANPSGAEFPSESSVIFIGPIKLKKVKTTPAMIKMKVPFLVKRWRTK